MNAKITLNDYRKAFVSNRKKAKQELTKGVNSTFFIMTGLITGLFLYYVWTLNSNATAGYNMKDLEREKNELLETKELLITKIAQLDSLGVINNDDIKQYIEPVSDPNYIVIKKGKDYVFNK